MKSIIALGVGLVVVLGPAGTAFAAPAEFGTGKGNAWGNCKHSSATGNHAPLEGGAGNGNGGHVTAAKSGESCVPVTEPVKEPAEEPTSGTTGGYVAPEDAGNS